MPVLDDEANQLPSMPELGPVAVPTGTTEKPPTKPVYGPEDPRSMAGKTAISFPPAVQKVADILSPPGTPSRKVFSVLGAMSTVDLERDVAAELQQAHPVFQALMGLPIGAPVGSLAGTAGRGVLTQTGRAATQAARKAAPIARRLAMEETGAVRLTRPEAVNLADLRKRLSMPGGLNDRDYALLQRLEARQATPTAPPKKMTWSELRKVPHSTDEKGQDMVWGKLKDAQFAARQFRNQAGGKATEVVRITDSDKPTWALVQPSPSAPFTTPTAKESWEMTKVEYVKSAKQWRAENMPRLQGKALDTELAGVSQAHAQIVRQALAEGKRVPPEVLADYPALRPGGQQAIVHTAQQARRAEIAAGQAEMPITTPVASEALSPAAKAAKATESVIPVEGRYTVPELLKLGGYDAEQSAKNLAAARKRADSLKLDAMVFNDSEYRAQAHKVLNDAEIADITAQETAITKARAEYGIRPSSKAPVGARRTPQQVSESVEQIPKKLSESFEQSITPTGASTSAAEQVVPPSVSAAPPAKPPAKPPVTTGNMPPVEPVLPRPRTLADMNREAKGMRAMTPEQRAAVMDVAQPIKGNILYQAKPFNEHARNLLGPDTQFNKALRSVPGVKQLFGAWNPAAMARDNPVAMIGLRQGIFQEIEKARIRFSTLRWWDDADEAFGFKRSGTVFGVRPTSGVWKASKVQPSSASVERGKMFGTINDIIEHPERYALNEAQKKVLALADNTLTQSVRDAQRAGVNVVELAEAYWPRAVTKGPQGEKGFAGIRRRVSGSKGYTHQRVFADVDDLVKAGFDVETDPRRVFAARLEAGIDTIAQANARKQIVALPGVEKPLERMGRKFPEALESSRQARTARDTAKAVVVKAGAKATPEQVMAMRQAEADYITSMREVFAKKIEAGTPGYYELRLPSGRIAPQELVEQVGKFIDLPELRQGATGGAARLTQAVSQLLRTSLTNVDLAAGYIQGQALFYRNNVAWWKAQGASVVSLIDDPTAWVAKNYELIDEGVRAGAIVAPTEFLFAKQGIASIPLRIPYVGPALGSFNRAFEWFITAGQTELYRAARSGAFKSAGMDELVSLGSAIRKEVGTESYAILGVRPNQHTMEALILFAARFFRANVGLLGQSFTRGPGGAEARKALGSLIAGGTAITIGINWAQNKKLPNMTDPYAPGWMQFKLGKTYFSAFGPFYPYFRTIARMSVALGEGDVMKAATQAKQFLQSKESLPLRAIDIGGQLVYYGSANVYGTKVELNWASVAKGILSEFVTPISAQEIPSGFAEGRPESALEFVGLVGRPVRLASEWAKEFDEYREIPSNPNEVKARKYEIPGKVMKTWEAYRKANPNFDATLFITGLVDELQTWTAKIEVVRLMRENGIQVKDIRSLEKKPYESKDKAALRSYLERALAASTQSSSPSAAPSSPTGVSEQRRKEIFAKYGISEATPVPAGAR